MENTILMGSFWSVGVILGLVGLVLTVQAVTLTCQEAIDILMMPCTPYLTTPEPSPTLACCKAVANINASATTTQARRDLCECFKKAAPAYGIATDKAKQLPGLCGVQNPVPIDPSVDCQSIQ